MPPLGSTRERPLGIYTVLMIVSAVFLGLAALVTYTELKSDYDFGGTEGYVSEEYYEEPAEESVTEEAEEPVE